MTSRIGKRLRALVASRHGATAMEFAVLALPFALLLINVLEFSRLQWTRAAIEESASAGARCGGLHAVSCSNSGDPRTFDATKTKNFIISEAANWSITLPTANVTVASSATCQSVAGLVQVTITYQFTSALLSLAGLSSYPISSTACYPNQT